MVEEFKCGIISRADMLGEMDMINSKTIKAKRALVAQVHVKGKGDNPPVGILLCTKKGPKMVEYALSGMDNNQFV